ncbi:MAG: tetratricopeptide repeat protein [Candidatus Polarisedimenticolia bacterium]
MLNPRDLTNLFSEESADKVLARAQKLTAKGRNDQAAQVIKEAIGRLGDDPDLRLELAALSLGAGRTKEAADSLRALLKASPSQVSRVEEFVGLMRGQHSDVEALFEPLAEGHAARRNYNAALDWLEKINRKTLEGLVAARLSSLNRFLEKGSAVPKSAVPTLYIASLQYEAIGDWHKAINSYSKILVAAPNEFATVDERLRNLVGRHYKTVPLRLTFAELLQSLGHQDRALQEYLTALEVDPRCAPHVTAYLQSRLEAAPGDPDLLWSCVKVDLAAGHMPEAMERCGLLADMKVHLPEIEKLLEELSAGGKETVDTQLLLARVATAQGKASRAISAVVAAVGGDAGARGVEALERLVEAFPNEPRPYQILADVYMRDGRVADCLEVYKRLRAMDPSSGPSIATRLQAVLMADPSNAAARALLEDVCVESGDARGAVPFLRRRLRESPATAADMLERLRALRMSNPGDRQLSLASAEACLAIGDHQAAWGFLQDLIQDQGTPEPELLHLLVLAAGASADLCRTASAAISSKAPSWMARPEIIFALAEAAGRAGMLREAVSGYRSAASAAPEASSVCRDAVRALTQQSASAPAEERAALAEALAGIDDLPAAIEVLRGIRELPSAAASRLIARLHEALKRDARNLDLIACVAQVCLASGQLPRALELCRTGLAGREDAASAPLALTYGDALLRQGKASEAVRAYATAVQRDLSLAKEAIERLRGALQIDGGLDAARVTLGRLLMHEGQVEEATRELMAAWATRSDLAPSILKDLERAARKQGGMPCLDIAQARLLAALGKTEDAAELLGGPALEDPSCTVEVLSLLESIVERHPTGARAHLELGRSCVKQGWVSRACAALARAHHLDRSLEGSVRVALSALEEAHKKDPQPLLCRAAIEEAGQRWLPAAEALAQAASMKGPRADEALAGLARIGALSGVPGKVHLLRARACRLAGRVEECVAAARAALESDASLAGVALGEIDRLLEAGPVPTVLLARAECRLRLQELDGAARDLHDALCRDASGIATQALPVARALASRHPGRPLVAMALARALEAAGETGDAAAALDEALAAGSSHDVALLLARRRLAVSMGDRARAAELLGLAERAASSRDRLLAVLHEEMLAGSPVGNGKGSPAEEAIAAGEYARAAALMAGDGPSLRRAWVLERCGRAAEAAACLELLANDPEAAQRSVALHDRVLTKALLGKEPALMAEAPLQIGQQGTQALAAKGGVS